MKTLAVTQLRQITGGRRGYTKVLDPVARLIGPGLVNPEPPIDDDVTPVILQEVVSLTRVNFVTF